jgi:hypothetical protein
MKSREAQRPIRRFNEFGSEALTWDHGSMACQVFLRKKTEKSGILACDRRKHQTRNADAAIAYERIWQDRNSI